MDLQTPNRFDNNYYTNLLTRGGLLYSDQELFNNGRVDWLVRVYSSRADAFMSDFAAAMVKMGNIDPLWGRMERLEKNCG
ncbi:UNVERIFIED_CONTAM: Lignin-forming anionic peroxidase [Sesamum calycinum]|uniref:peroxidase n=1 Tax=Sesamum calycinum TaxID=2727403 RepID=A0AAW2JKM6_9LAMI